MKLRANFAMHPEQWPLSTQLFTTWPDSDDVNRSVVTDRLSENQP